ncbi:hypothetical protein [Krasilnikovia sp. MM14-A1259]|uniref:hypothetical protein n=1 Tax=Krasilnikovia sp. MM14-A1259 TaxID=3373539 RepID=UPI00381EF2E6
MAAAQRLLPSPEATDPATGAEVQQRWLTAFAELADLVNPGFGHIAPYAHGGQTASEARIDKKQHPGRELRDPSWTVGRCRQVLRGYSWVTILAGDLADRVGGAEALMSTGAFVAARRLANGGMWLQATADYREYDERASDPVFRALVPAASGGPGPPAQAAGQPPVILVYADPAAAADDRPR